MRLDLRRRRGLCALLLLLCCGSSVSLNQRFGRLNSRVVHHSGTPELGRCYRESHPFSPWLHQPMHPLDVCMYSRSNSNERSVSEDGHRERSGGGGGDYVSSTSGGVPAVRGEVADTKEDSDGIKSRSGRDHDGEEGHAEDLVSVDDALLAENGDSETGPSGGQDTDASQGQLLPEASIGASTSEAVQSSSTSAISNQTEVPPTPWGESSQTDDVVTEVPASADPVSQVEPTLDAERGANSIAVDGAANGSGSSSSSSSTVTSDTKQQLLEAVAAGKTGTKPDGRDEEKRDGAVGSDNVENGTSTPRAKDTQEQTPLPASAGQQENDTTSVKQNDTENATSILNDSIIDGKEAMPSFDEWKKIRLEQEQLQEVPSQTKIKEPEQREAVKPMERKRGRRNYASLECGAKLLSANPGAESASKVLLESKDEYMLNPCNSLQKEGMWFVVELCESIHPTHIELANFELYSSTGREFVVYMGDPDQSREWTAIGRFEMAQLKTVQSFPLDAPGFGKAIKVEFQSIYENNQYYCPLSLVRVFGSSMVDDYEEKVSEDVSGQLEPEQPTTSKKPAEPSAGGSPVNADTTSGGGENMVSRARQAVINIISSVSQAVSGTSSTRSAADSNCTDCQESGSKVTDNDSKAASIVPPEFDGCLELTNLSGSEGLLWPSMRCHRKPFIKELERSCSYRDPKRLADLMETETLPISHPPLQTKSMTPPSAFITSTVADITPTPTTEPMKDVKTQILVSIIPPDPNAKREQQQQLDDPQQKLNTAQDQKQAEQQSQKKATDMRGDSQASSVEPSSHKTQHDDKGKRSDGVHEPPDSVSTTSKPSIKPAPQQQQQQQQQQNLVLSPQPIIPLTKPIGQAGNGPATPTKENLFSRFESRIRHLELNTNLSSDYLQELSQRYRKQMEEMQAAFNKTVAVLNAEAKKAAERDQNQQVALGALQEKLTSAAESLRMLEAERDSLWWRLLLVYLALLIASVAILIVILHIVPRRAIASFMKSDLLERRIRDVLAARERALLAELARKEAAIQEQASKVEDLPPIKQESVKSELQVKDPTCPADPHLAGDSKHVENVPPSQTYDLGLKLFPAGDGVSVCRVKTHDPAKEDIQDGVYSADEGPQTKVGSSIEGVEPPAISKKRRRRHRGKALSKHCSGASSSSCSHSDPVCMNGSTSIAASSASFNRQLHQASAVANSKPALFARTANLFRVLASHTQDARGESADRTPCSARSPQELAVASTSSPTHGRRKQQGQHSPTTSTTLPAAGNVTGVHQRSSHELSGASGMPSQSPPLARSL